MNYDVPFVANTDDNLHCLQAVYLMIVKFFKPDFEVDWEEWSKITGFEKGKGTYATAGQLWFKENGFDVKQISMFDNQRFIEIGGDYLIELSGEEVGKWQVEHSNIPLEQKRTKQLLASGICEQREPTIQDIKDLLNVGYLVHCLVNARKLNKQQGYFGHAIVVCGYNDEALIIHDPGLPALKNKKVLFDDFEAAWADPNKEAKEMDAIKLL
ncbi:MAG TPA: C39 family peptidase [Candidatus Saccharimonadales bacterium]|nr:C39 family peptidase [Candidatus Saccharimonadales bacterium]